MQDEGTIRAGANWHDSLPNGDRVANYLFNVGLAPGLELGGRIAQLQGFQGPSNDLSLNAKLRLWQFDNGPSIAIGGQDIAGEAQNFRSRYAVATLPWRTLSFTAGHRWGPDLPEGTIAGLEWRPWSFLGVYAEYDTDEVNPGLKLQSAPLWGGLQIGANAGYRQTSDEVEGGIEFSIPLGRRRAEVVGRQSIADVPAAGGMGMPPYTQLRADLQNLGFEAVRTGARPDGTLLVALENRRYNHSSADGIGLALGAIAARAPDEVARIELMLSAYGVPQVAVATPAQAYRDFLRDGAAAPDLIDVRYTQGAGGDVSWHNPAVPLKAAELVIEPVLRSFVATEYGVLDAGLGARARLTMPLGPGVTSHFGVQAPVVRTGDFRDGRNFGQSGPESGLDLMLVQYAHKLSPAWTWLWSAGLTQVVQTDLRVAGLEQLWASPEGSHRLSAKLMVMDSGVIRREVALAGYAWYDVARRYSASITGGRFYAGDEGFRLDVNRDFGDTLVGVFLKVESEDNMAGGFQLSLPLTPRRDAAPRTLQVKGPRRWGHSLQTTLNLADGTNALKPLLLYEPLVDLELRRDFLDSGRLSPEYLRGELPRMREAYLLWDQ